MTLIDSTLVVGIFERVDANAVAALKAMGMPVRSPFVSGELQAGIETATSEHDRAIRQRTFERYLRATAEPAGAERGWFEQLATEFALFTGTAKRHRIRIGQTDRWILSEAAASSQTVATMDEAMCTLGNLARPRASKRAAPFVELIRPAE